MGKVRVELEHVLALHFPPMCPCCLATPATTSTPLVKGGAAVYRATWPHCDRCAGNERRRQRSLFWTQALAVVGLLTLAIGAPVLFYTRGSWGSVALAAGAVLPVLAVVLHRGSVASLSPPSNAARKGAGVEINYGGAHLLGNGYVLDVTFLQAEYGRQFVELNRAAVVKVTEGA